MGKSKLYLQALFIMVLCLTSCSDRQEKQVNNIQETQSNGIQKAHFIDTQEADQDNPGGSDPGETVNNEKIRIISPQDSSQVSRDVTVEGTAIVPAGSHVWALARRVDFEPFWWPQREVKIDQGTQRWQTTVSLGEPQDIGRDFNIGIGIVDEQEHLKLMEYWENAMESGGWKPIRVSEVISKLQIITVTKTSH